MKCNFFEKRRFVACPVSLMLTLAATGAAHATPKNILIIYSFSPSASPYYATTSAFESALTRELKEPVDIYAASLDSDRFSEPQDEEAYVHLLRERFDKRRLALIVPIGSPAARFVAQYREQFSPATPVVAVQVDPRLTDSEALQRNATIVRQDVRLDGIIEDMLTVAPNTANIAVIFGDSPLERFWAKECRRDFQAFGSLVNFIWLDGLPLDEVEKRVSTLPQHCFVFLGLFIRDVAGVSYDGYEPLRRLHAAANAPIYGYFQSQMGFGIIGGRLNQNETMGTHAAAAAVRILRGEPAANIPEDVLPTASPVYDWRELKRWGIPEARLPAGSSIRFREPTFWERYRWYITGAGVLILIELLLIVGLLKNLASRRRAEHSLRQSEERLRLAAEAAEFGAHSYDASTGQFFCTPEVIALFGLPPGAAIKLDNKSVPEALHPDDKDRFRSHLLAAADPGGDRILDIEYRVIRPDEQLRWLRTRGKIIFSADGRPIRADGITQDITGRKHAGEALQASEERFRQVAESVSDFVWEVAADGLYTYTSPSVEKILGYTPNELVGKMHFYDLFSPDEREHLTDAAFQAFAKRERFQAFPNTNVSKTGKIVYLETSGMPILGETGQLLGYRGANTDVTERRQAEMEMRRISQELALFSRAATMSELAASIAHEINQPLAAILSNAQAALRLMEHGAADLTELREIFSDIVEDDQRAAEVIRTMRSMLRKSTAEHKPLLLNGLIENVVALVRNEALARKVSVFLDLGLLLTPIQGDRVQLQQVILNLVVNAFDAMETSALPRKLILRTRETGAEAVLDVADSGSGIPAEKLDSIFEPFYTTKATGLGMGLSLSRSIVIAHNGRLWAENNPDGGATIHLALPTRKSMQPAVKSDTNIASQSDGEQRQTGCVVLLVDDKESFRHAVSSILAALPHLRHISEAADGEEALEKAAAIKPDLVMLDIGLPVVNGIEVASRMQTIAPDCKLLFLTQYDSPDFVGAALRAGALGYILKTDAGSELLLGAMAVLRGDQYLSSGIRHCSPADA